MARRRGGGERSKDGPKAVWETVCVCIGVAIVGFPIGVAIVGFPRGLALRLFERINPLAVTQTCASASAHRSCSSASPVPHFPSPRFRSHSNTRLVPTSFPLGHSMARIPLPVISLHPSRVRATPRVLCPYAPPVLVQSSLFTKLEVVNKQT